MAPSVSPREFFATHLYDPKSAMSTSLMVNFITTLYALSKVSGTNLSPAKKLERIVVIQHKTELFPLKLNCIARDYRYSVTQYRTRVYRAVRNTFKSTLATRWHRSYRQTSFNFNINYIKIINCMSTTPICFPAKTDELLREHNGNAEHTAERCEYHSGALGNRIKV